MLFDMDKNKLIDTYKAHSRRVSDIWVQEGKDCVLTCSYDSTLYYKSILGDFPSSKFDHSKDLKEELESCAVVIDEPLGKDYKITKYLVGTMSG